MEEERKAELELEHLEDVQAQQNCECEVWIEEEHIITDVCRQLTLKCDLCGSKWKGIVYKE